MLKDVKIYEGEVINPLDGAELVCVKTCYAYGGRTALLLMGKETGEPYATATINVEEVSLKENEVIIKNYSENKDIDRAIEEAGIGINLYKEVQVGFVKCPIFYIHEEGFRPITEKELSFYGFDV